MGGVSGWKDETGCVFSRVLSIDGVMTTVWLVVDFCMVGTIDCIIPYGHACSLALLPKTLSPDPTPYTPPNGLLRN